MLDIHDYTWLYMYVWLLVYIHVFLSMILPILKPSKIPRVSKSCQLHWAFGQGTQAEEIGCSAMSVGGICCIVLSINQDMFSHSWLPFEMRRSCEHLLRTLISIPLLPKQHVALYADFKNYEKNMELPDLFFDTETFLFSLHLRVQSQHWFWMALVGLWSLRLHAARPSCVCTWICRGAKRADGGRVWHSVTPLQSSQCMCELCESEFCRAFWGMAIHESAAFLHMPVGSSRRPQRIYVNQTSCSTALTFANICIPGFTTSVLSRMITAASPCGSSQNSCQTLNSETPLHWKWMNMVCKCLQMFAWFAWCKCSGFNVQRYPPQLESSWLHRSMLTPEFNFFHCRWSVEISVSSSIGQAKSRKQHETKKTDDEWNAGTEEALFLWDRIGKRPPEEWEQWRILLGNCLDKSLRNSD